MKAVKTVAFLLGVIVLAGLLGMPKSGRQQAVSQILAATASGTRPAGPAAATVNGEPILESDLMAALPEDAFDTQLQSAKWNRLQRLVEEAVRAQFLKENKIEVSAKELEEGIDEYTKMVMTPGCPCCGGGYSGLDEFMKANFLTASDIRRIVTNDVGLRLYKGRLVEERLTPDGLARTVSQRRAEIEKDYIQGYAIVFDCTQVAEYWKDPNGVRAKKEKFALDAWGRLKNGDAFEKVAKEMSEDPASAPKGGAMGLVPTDRLGQEAQEAWETLKPGDYSRPIKTGRGYVILKRQPLTEEDLVSLVKDEMSSYVSDLVFHEYKAARGRAKIQYKDDSPARPDGAARP